MPEHPSRRHTKSWRAYDKPQSPAAKPGAPAAKPADKPAPAVKVEVELAGNQDRVFELPLPAGVYSGLAVGEKALFFIDRESQASGQPKLQAVEVKSRNVQARTLLEYVRSFEMSADGKKLFVRRENDLYAIDAATGQPTSQTLAERRFDAARWSFSIDPREEWRQMFLDAWQMERDYFYDRNLHNVDYQGLLDRHRPIIASLAFCHQARCR